MVPAAPINAAGNPPGWDVVNNVQLPLPQFGTTFPWNINAEPSGPTRAFPTDGRAGGTPDPTTSGPDFVVIGNDGGLLPQGVDIPSQPVTYEQNRRSITVTNIYGYGLLLGTIRARRHHRRLHRLRRQDPDPVQRCAGADAVHRSA